MGGGRFAMSTGDPVQELEVQYSDLIGVIDSVSEEEAWLPTGCLGFAVRDLILHVLSDAQRALVALATPVDRAPDRDAITYWSDSPGPDDPQWRSLRSLRSMASAYSLEALKRDWRANARAVVALLGRTDRTWVVETQDHALTVPDLAATLVFESCVHHLDLVEQLDRPGPGAGPLGVVRATLDGLLGRPEPLDWDDVTYARKATGRRDLTRAEADALGVVGPRFSLIP
jgi:hypothetical protein